MDGVQNAEKAQQHPGTITTINPAEENCKQQCRPNKTQPYAIKTDPRRRQNRPTHS